MDPRTPDIILKVDTGVIFTGGTKICRARRLQRGRRAYRTARLPIPGCTPSRSMCRVSNQQVAATVVRALGYDPQELEAVRKDSGPRPAVPVRRIVRRHRPAGAGRRRGLGPATRVSRHRVGVSPPMIANARSDAGVSFASPPRPPGPVRAPDGISDRCDHQYAAREPSIACGRPPLWDGSISGSHKIAWTPRGRRRTFCARRERTHNSMGERMESEGKCPVTGGSHRHTATGAKKNTDWWPDQLNLKVLHQDVAWPVRWTRTSTMRSFQAPGPRGGRARTCTP